MLAWWAEIILEFFLSLLLVVLDSVFYYGKNRPKEKKFTFHESGKYESSASIFYEWVFHSCEPFPKKIQTKCLTYGIFIVLVKYCSCHRMLLHNDVKDYLEDSLEEKDQKLLIVNPFSHFFLTRKKKLVGIS